MTKYDVNSYDKSTCDRKILDEMKTTKSKTFREKRHKYVFVKLFIDDSPLLGRHLNIKSNCEIIYQLVDSPS